MELEDISTEIGLGMRILSSALVQKDLISNVEYQVFGTIKKADLGRLSTLSVTKQF